MSIQVVLAITAAILMILGSVDALQFAAIITGGPFAFVCFLAMLGLISEFGSRFGRVILQDEAWIVGSCPERSSSPDVVPGDDDD